MGNVSMEASQINYRGGETKMSVEQALKETSGEAAAIAQLQTDVGNLQTTKANQITIAPFFSAETAYDPGDLVYYNGMIYRCVNAHEGEWDADDFAATTISTELDSLKSGLNNLLSTGSFVVSCAAGVNKFSRSTALVSGSLPSAPFGSCLFNIVNHGLIADAPNTVEADGNSDILISAVTAQNITVRWLDLTNLLVH